MLWVWIAVALLSVAGAFYFAPKGWRTVAVNAVIPVLAGLAEVIPAIQVGLPDDWAVWGIITTNILNLVLRKLTDTKMGKAEQ